MGWRIVTTEEAQALWECGVKLLYRNSAWAYSTSWHKFCHRTWSPAVYSDAYTGYLVEFKVHVEGE